MKENVRAIFLWLLYSGLINLPRPVVFLHTHYLQQLQPQLQVQFVQLQAALQESPHFMPEQQAVVVAQQPDVAESLPHCIADFSVVTAPPEATTENIPAPIIVTASNTVKNFLI
jgi:hypothetical protein